VLASLLPFKPTLAVTDTMRFLILGKADTDMDMLPGTMKGSLILAQSRGSGNLFVWVARIFSRRMLDIRANLPYNNNANVRAGEW
ncbi:MAG: hypothetical protein WHX60_14765, partial [Armatimonadota bacterium]